MRDSVIGRLLAGRQDAGFGRRRQDDQALGRRERARAAHPQWAYRWIQSVVFCTRLTERCWRRAVRDKTIKLWDVASGRELRTLNGHSGWVVSVASRPTGRCWPREATTERQTVGHLLRQGACYAHRLHGRSSLAITPEGYYDASSAAAEENLNVRIGDRVFAIGSYRQKFYRPDLVKLSLAGKSLSRFGSIGNEKLRQSSSFSICQLPPQRQSLPSLCASPTAAWCRTGTAVPEPYRSA